MSKLKFKINSDFRAPRIITDQSLDQLRGLGSAKLFKFFKIIHIDLMLYYTCIHCLLTLCESMRLKNVCEVLNFAFSTCKLTVIKSKKNVTISHNLK